ncbi:DUF4937 domain-containing protein [Candidatus Uabimicrobium sp. HlEnr_7]|uniref:DUF4937 domain-containing protein n=1 Tax=Candidatus Uabimicrobium helgolandensis TaxID=3095367 RepID=UPI003557BFE9
MLLKWITCEVDQSQRENFSQAQEQWNCVKNSVGFIGQVGGWCKNTSLACILTLWENKKCYDNFFLFVHDAITSKNEQQNYYNKIQVALAEPLIWMPGTERNIEDAVHSATILRVSECTIATQRQNHFIDMQLNLWVPAMARAGMLTGYFSHINENRFLVTTLWEEKTYRNYVEEQLPLCQEQSKAAKDLLKIVGYEVILLDQWQVINSIKI